MRVILAPMEGVLDAPLRDLLTTVGGIDSCVTEFVRVTNTRLPKRVFYRFCPELLHHSKTPAGTPTTVQLLGSNPEMMAANALHAAMLGAPAIDINFGCPAKTVNKNNGGAILLKTPETLYQIVSAVRQSVPAHIPVSAKMRLGFDDKSLAIENAQAIESAGASELTIHARTKVEGYKPPAHWEWIARVKEQVTLPIIANGEIWTLDDYINCRAISGCDDIMLGRGIVACPDLALQIHKHNNQQHYQPMQCADIQQLLIKFYDLIKEADKEKFATSRIKQWTGLLSRNYPICQGLFQQIKRMKTLPEIYDAISQPTISKVA